MGYRGGAGGHDGRAGGAGGKAVGQGSAWGVLFAALREETAVIDAAMQRLTRDEREVAKLRYRRPGMNNCEIAAALYCSEGWVRLTRKRLVRKIAEGIGIL